MGKPDAVLADIRKSIKLNPHHYQSCLMIDYLNSQTRQWGKIIEQWDNFLELEPEHAEALFQRSGTHYHNKDMASAVKDLECACQLGHEQACSQLKRVAGGKK